MHVYIIYLQYMSVIGWPRKKQQPKFLYGLPEWHHFLKILRPDLYTGFGQVTEEIGVPDGGTQRIFEVHINVLLNLLIQDSTTSVFQLNCRNAELSVSLALR